MASRTPKPTAKPRAKPRANNARLISICSYAARPDPQNERPNDGDQPATTARLGTTANERAVVKITFCRVAPFLLSQYIARMLWRVRSARRGLYKLRVLNKTVSSADF